MVDYGTYRKIRPDGNCFYRAYLFGILESVSKNGKEAILALSEKFRALSLECKQFGYDAFTVDEFHELLEEQIQTLLKHPNPLEVFSDASVDCYLVALLRCITGAGLKKWSDDYLPFLPEPYECIDAFCRTEVDPMYRDCDQLQITALVRMMEDWGLDIVYFDAHSPLSVHSFGPSDNKISLLYKPGHYDLLYRV